MHTTPTISEMVPTPKPPSLVEEANPPPVPIGGLRPVPEHLIRRGYAPALRDARSNSNAYAIDPLTGQQVRFDEMEEHMRISLLDPKWKEQKQIEEDRRKDSNLAGLDDINKNLKSFAARRTDIFGDDEVAIGQVVDGVRNKVQDVGEEHT